MKINKFISIIHRNKQKYIKERLKELDIEIGISDYPVLLIVNSKKAQGPTEIAKAFDLTKSQVSQGIRKLEKLGYVTQQRDPGNRSKVVVDITPEGKELAKILKKIAREWHELACEGFEEEELKTFHRTLLKITNNVCGEDERVIYTSPSKNK